MNNILFFIVFFYSISAIAQTELSINHFTIDTGKFVLGTVNEFSMNSNGLNNKFIYQLSADGYITSEIKNHISSKLKANHQFGGDINTSIFFSQRLDSIFKAKRFNYFIQAGSRTHFNGNFTKDLFNFTFFGNKKFAGKTANLSGSNFSLLQYQQLQLGIFSHQKNNSKIGSSISLLNGRNYLSWDINQLTIHTDELGEQIDVNAVITKHQSDTLNNTYKGLGLSLAFYYEKELNLSHLNENFKGWFRFEVSDIGFINWNKNAITSSIDTVFEYKGFQIENLLKINDSIFNELDSIRDNSNFSKKESFQTILPANLNITFAQSYKKHTLVVGAIHRIPANFNTYVYLQESYKLNDRYSIFGLIGYGGYGKTNIGIGGYLNYSTFKLKIGSNNIEGLIVRNYSAGTNIYLSAKKYF